MTLFGLPEFQISAGVLLALVVLMVLTGRLVPRRQLEDLREDRDARLEAAERQIRTWMAAYDAAVQSRRTAEEHVTELMEAARAAQDIIRALPVPLSPMPEARSHATDEA